MKLLLFLLVITFSACRFNSSDNIDLSSIEKEADDLVTKTFDTLKKTLVTTISEKGVAGAVEVCNISAISLTGLYTKNGISIKRATDRPRNQNNLADSTEQRIISLLSQIKNSNKQLSPILEKDLKGVFHYYKPIIIQGMCLSCHGKRSEQIQDDTWKMIASKYPVDSAFNYSEGDLRGIWHVSINKK